MFNFIAGIAIVLTALAIAAAIIIIFVGSDEEYNYNPKDYSCYGCPDVDICKYAYDPYNKNGDCLASK